MFSNFKFFKSWFWNFQKIMNIQQGARPLFLKNAIKSLWPLNFDFRRQRYGTVAEFIVTRGHRHGWARNFLNFGFWLVLTFRNEGNVSKSASDRFWGVFKPPRSWKIQILRWKCDFRYLKIGDFRLFWAVLKAFNAIAQLKRGSGGPQGASGRFWTCF